MRIAVVMALVMLFTLPISALADEADDGTITSNGLTAGKHIHVEEDGTYTIELEAFGTGEATFETITAPADIILVLDVSGSMSDNINSYEYTARSSQNYSYNGYGSSQYYYKDNDGKYHLVTRNRTGRGTWTNPYHYYLRYSRTDNNSNWTYLQGTGTTNTAGNGEDSATDTIWTGVLYTRRTIQTVTKIDALKTAVGTFIDEVATKNKESKEAGALDSELSRIAIVKFAGNSRNGTDYANYQNNIGNERYGTYNYNYTQVVGDLDFVNEGTSTTDPTTTASWKNKVNAFTAAGATGADYGMGYADAIFDKHPLTEADQAIGRQRVVVMFTDGEPNHQSGFDGTVANAAISSSKEMKDAGVLVYTVAVYEGASNAEPPETDINKYLHGVSSNYPAATGYNSLGTRGEGNFYFVAENADQLEQIFKEIGKSSGQSATQINSEAVMKDVVSSSFTLPENATVDDIQIKIVRWDSTAGVHNWGSGAGYEFTPAQWQTECLNYGAEAAENVTASISADGTTVDVTGFDYHIHYKATNAEQDNDTYDVVGGVNKNTAKIVVSFPIQAKTSAVTGSSVATNGEESGIYVNGEATSAVIYFPVPHVTFTPVTYVVDYVTSDTSTDTKASTIKLDYTGVLSDVDMLDDPSDDVLIGKDKLDFEYTIYKGKFGTISFGDDEVDVQRRYVRYAPTTMNWNDYDRIFIKGTSKNDSNLDVWAMLAVIPANNVFYEDTYITQTKTVEYNDQTVTIEYTGIAYDSSWNTVGTEGTNQTQHADHTMGWIDGLSDDATYANDMAHTSSTSKAKASFTFSGTGVDIYSRTNGSTGTVLISLKSAANENASGAKIAKSQIIDTKAAAGDFFAIPVCTFTDLPYGKYSVTITVTTGGKAEGRMTFYLDGVRVYNPIQQKENDEVVQEVYGEKNLGAVFTEVRSLLGSGAQAEALYLDELTTSDVVTNLDKIEEAAQALSQAQQDRDAYVEGTITPAKNAVSNAEYELSSAEAAANNADAVYETTVTAYNAAVAALEADPENAELQAAVEEARNTMNAKKAEKDAADAAYAAAQSEFNGKIGGLRDALEAAINGKAPYDEAVDAAIAAYDEANDGVTVAYSEATIAQYQKEGPIHEVLLDKNQQVAISVEAGKYYFIGLKSLNGRPTTATINGQQVTYTIGDQTYNEISHTTDLYYEATPASGNTIVIKNTGDNILSVTKLRTSGAGNKSKGTRLASSQETLNFVRSLAKKAVVEDEEYTGEVLTAEEAGAVEAAEAAVEEVTETVLDESDIAIETQETEPETEVEEEAEAAPAAPSAWSRLLSSFSGFFRR